MTTKHKRDDVAWIVEVPDDSGERPGKWWKIGFPFSTRDEAVSYVQDEVSYGKVRVRRFVAVNRRAKVHL
jgi:hypothetical protein